MICYYASYEIPSSNNNTFYDFVGLGMLFQKWGLLEFDILHDQVEPIVCVSL